MRAAAPDLLQLVIVDRGATGLAELLRRPGWAQARLYAPADDGPRRLILRNLPPGADVRAAAAETDAVRSHDPAGVDNIYRCILRAPDDGGPFFTGKPVSVVMLDMLAEREQAMNEWYDESHVPNLLLVPGYRVAARYRLVAPAERGHPMQPEYLALYELDGDEAIPLIGPERERMTPAAIAELGVFERDWAPVVHNLGWAVFRPCPAVH